jgi:hypothetical protein
VSTAGRKGDAVTQAGRLRAATAVRTPSPGDTDAGSRSDALLANPGSRGTTSAQKAEADRLSAAQERSAAVAVCGYVIRAGCGGAGCQSPAHREHAGRVREALRTLGLLDDLDRPLWTSLRQRPRGRKAAT